MPSLRSVAAISLMAGLAASSPIDASSTKGAYSIKQVHMGYFQKNPAQNMAATYAKFGGLMPYELAQAAANNNTGSAPTNPGDAHDSLYLTPVNVGGTTMMLDFDTGSADLWVFSNELPASQSAGHAVYKPDASKKMDGASWKISYGDGSSASGDVYKDTVTVGGIAVDGQAVEAASQISKQFASDKKNDGLLGLAFSSINTVQPTQQTTWVKTAIDAGDLKEAVFAAKLEHQKPGSYDFGFIDDSAYTGELAYTDIDNSQGFWSLKTDGYAVGSSEKNTPITGIADTGTTLIYVPTAVANDYYSQVNGAKFNSQYGGYVFDCSAELPDFSLTINGQKRTTPGEFVNYSPISAGSSTCFGGIQRNTGLQGLSIFGDIFLKSQYVVFDMAQNRIGFAPQKSS